MNVPVHCIHCRECGTLHRWCWLPLRKPPCPWQVSIVFQNQDSSRTEYRSVNALNIFLSLADRIWVSIADTPENESCTGAKEVFQLNFMKPVTGMNHDNGSRAFWVEEERYVSTSPNICISPPSRFTCFTGFVRRLVSMPWAYPFLVTSYSIASPFLIRSGSGTQGNSSESGANSRKGNGINNNQKGMNA